MKTSAIKMRLLAFLAVLPLGLHAQLDDWPTPAFLPADTDVHPIFVRPGLTSGANDGSSWADAFRSLDAALLEAPGAFSDGDDVQFIIGAGTIVPPPGSSGTIEFPNTIDLPAGAGSVNLRAVRGGYTDYDPTDPNFDGPVRGGSTIFDGESDRFSVITIPAGRLDLLIENVTIRNGEATAAAPSPLGGPFGGGMFVPAAPGNDSVLHLHAVTFERNFSADGGGALFLQGRDDANVRSDRKVIISDSLFFQNDAEISGGGAVWNEKRDVKVLQSAFDNNTTSQGQGGAIYNSADGSILVQSNVFFENNSDQQGGAFYGANRSISRLVNNHFVVNRATQEAGAVFLAINAEIPFRPGSTTERHFFNNFFYGNLSGSTEFVQVGHPGTQLGGRTESAIDGWQGNLVVDRDGNEATYFRNFANARGADNVLGTSADGLFPAAGSPLINAGRDNAVVSEGYGPFGEPSDRVYTRAVNAGTLGVAPPNAALDVRTTDDAGPAGLAQRIAGGQVEIGAYELQVPPPPPRPIAKVIYVDDNAPGDENGVHDGNSWESAYLFLQDALMRAHIDPEVNEIWVAEAENSEKWYVVTVDGQWQTRNELFTASGWQRLPVPERRDEIPAWKVAFDSDNRVAYNPGRPTALSVSTGAVANIARTDAGLATLFTTLRGNHLTEPQLPWALDRRPQRAGSEAPRTFRDEPYPEVSYFTRDRYHEMRAESSGRIVSDIPLTYVRTRSGTGTGFDVRRVVLHVPVNETIPLSVSELARFGVSGFSETGIGPRYTFPIMPTQQDRRIMVYGGFQGWRVSASNLNVGAGMKVPWKFDDSMGQTVEQFEVTWRTFRLGVDANKSWTVAEGARESYLVEQNTLDYETVLSGDLDISRHMIQDRIDGRFARTVMTVHSDYSQLGNHDLLNTESDPRYVGSMLVGGRDYDGPDHNFDGDVLEFDGNEFMPRVSDHHSIVDGVWIVDAVNTSSGGGIDLEDAYIIFNDIVVANNRAPSGAGVYVNAAGNVIEPQFLNSTFKNNLAKPGAGGAMFVTPLADVTIFNSNFLENEAVDGGAIYFAAGSNKTQIDRTVFANNRADASGGAIHMTNTDGGGDLVFTQVLFTGNYAGDVGGGIYAHNSDADVFNSVFSENFASRGPAVHNSGILSLVGVIIDENFVYNPSPIQQVSGRTPYVAPTWFSVITGGFATGIPSMNDTIIDGSPMFDDIGLVSLIPGAPITSALDAVIGFRDLNAAKTKVPGMPRDRVFGHGDDELGFQLTDGSVAIEAGLGGRDAGIYESVDVTGGVVEPPVGATVVDARAIGGGWFYSPLLADYVFVDGHWVYSNKYDWVYASEKDGSGAVVWQLASGFWWGIYGNFASDSWAFNFSEAEWSIFPRAD